jgi:hypothetical protein
VINKTLKKVISLNVYDIRGSTWSIHTHYAILAGPWSLMSNVIVEFTYL